MRISGSKKKKVIYIEPVGGLGNRMRVLASALETARLTNASLRCVWFSNKELNARYGELFEPIPELRFVQKTWKHRYLRYSYSQSGVKRVLKSILNRLLGFGLVLSPLDVEWHSRQHTSLDILVNRHHTVYIRSWNSFWGLDHIQIPFVPITELRQYIQQTTELFSDHTIGVHIRRTDHLKSIEFSPNGLFEVAMRNELDKEPSVKFFLCTDDPEVEAHFVKQFGHSIITRPKQLNRNSVSGIQDAVVDIYCLAATNKILGSYQSTFGKVASRIGNISITQLKTP